MSTTLGLRSQNSGSRADEAPTDFTEEYFGFLDSLRASGQTNMLGAGPYLQTAYPELSATEARKVLVAWMTTFFERHPELG